MKHVCVCAICDGLIKRSDADKGDEIVLGTLYDVIAAEAGWVELTTRAGEWISSEDIEIAFNGKNVHLDWKLISSTLIKDGWVKSMVKNKRGFFKV